MILNYFKKPVRLDALHAWLRQPGAKVLDVGCGNHSATKTKSYYPECLYYGADKNLSYNNDARDLACMEAFYEVDLSQCGALAVIPDDYFDCVIVSHVIEHIENGEDVLGELIKKMAPGGILYVEFPSEKSTMLPSMKGTLNFYDDPSHVKVYNLKKLNLFLSERGLSIIKSGTRRSLKRILFLPLYAGASLFAHGFISGHVLWDIAGFACCCIAQKQ